MLLAGTVGRDQVSQSTENYDLKGMIQPNFINEGNTPVRIMQSTIQPGGQMPFNFPNHVLSGKISIQFLSEGVEKAINLVNVYWVTTIQGQHCDI